MRFPAAWAGEVTEAADDVLRANVHRIRNGRLDGHPWPARVYRVAAQVVRRRRSVERRRAA